MGMFGENSPFGQSGLAGGLLGGMGINMSQIPFIGGMFPNPAEAQMQQALAGAAQSYAAAMPQFNQAYQNLLGNVMGLYSPAQTALQQIYGGGAPPSTGPGSASGASAGTVGRKVGEAMVGGGQGTPGSQPIGYHPLLVGDTFGDGGGILGRVTGTGGNNNMMQGSGNWFQTHPGGGVGAPGGVVGFAGGLTGGGLGGIGGGPDGGLGGIAGRLGGGAGGLMGGLPGGIGGGGAGGLLGGGIGGGLPMGGGLPGGGLPGGGRGGLPLLGGMGMGLFG